MNPEELHEQAMQLADDAFLAKMQKQDDKAISLLQQAANLEMEAANALSNSPDSEPSRSILYRSAASLAYDAADYKLADRLIAFGLTGFPPPEIERELKNLYEDVNFMRHVEARGVEISDDGFVMTVAGNSTSYGGALVEDVIGRLNSLRTTFYRTVERLMGIEFRIHGQVQTMIRKYYDLYLKAQVPASFGVYVQLGFPDPQLPPWPDLEPQKPINPTELINEVMACLDLWEKQEIDQLKQRINDEVYFDNFIGLATQLAPDGEDISSVAFTSGYRGAPGPVVLRTEKKKAKQRTKELASDIKLTDIEGHEFKITGLLLYAKTPMVKRKFGTIQVVDNSTGQKESIRVPIGYMKDTVQPYYEEIVEIEGYIDNNDRKILQTISLLEDSNSKN